MGACAQRLSQPPALGAFHVHYHLFYGGIFKSGGLGTAAAIVREQRRALGVSGGCGMPERGTELFSKCCAPHFMESRGGWPGQPCRQTELNSTHSCINGSLCAIPPHWRGHQPEPDSQDTPQNISSLWPSLSHLYYVLFLRCGFGSAAGQAEAVSVQKGYPIDYFVLKFNIFFPINVYSVKP